MVAGSAATGWCLSPFTYHDVAGILIAVLVFGLVLAGPGYLASWATNLLDFRQRTLGDRLVWSVPLSFGLTTMAAVIMRKYGSLGLACWVLVGMGWWPQRWLESSASRRQAAAGTGWRRRGVLFVCSWWGNWSTSGSGTSYI